MHSFFSSFLFFFSSVSYFSCLVLSLLFKMDFKCSPYIFWHYWKCLNTVAFRIHPACFDAARLGQTPQMFFWISCGFFFFFFFFKGTTIYMRFSYNKTIFQSNMSAKCCCFHSMLLYVQKFRVSYKQDLLSCPTNKI